MTYQVTSRSPNGMGFLPVAALAPLAAAGPPGWAALAITAGIQGAMIGLQLLFSRKGPEQKRKATQIANEAEVELQRNLDAYLGGPRTKDNQQAALAVFDYAWAQFVAYSQDPALGDPGQRAVRERGPGGQVPGTNGNWFIWYRDPIANDPQAQASTTALTSLIPGASDGLPLGLLAGIALLTLGAFL